MDIRDPRHADKLRRNATLLVVFLVSIDVLVYAAYAAIYVSARPREEQCPSREDPTTDVTDGTVNPGPTSVSTTILLDKQRSHAHVYFPESDENVPPGYRSRNPEAFRAHVIQPLDKSNVHISPPLRMGLLCSVGYVTIEEIFYSAGADGSSEYAGKTYVTCSDFSLMNRPTSLLNALNTSASVTWLDQTYSSEAYMLNVRFHCLKKPDCYTTSDVSLFFYTHDKNLDVPKSKSVSRIHVNFDTLYDKVVIGFPAKHFSENPKFARSIPEIPDRLQMHANDDEWFITNTVEKSYMFISVSFINKQCEHFFVVISEVIKAEGGTWAVLNSTKLIACQSSKGQGNFRKTYGRIVGDNMNYVEYIEDVVTKTKTLLVRTVCNGGSQCDDAMAQIDVQVVTDTLSIKSSSRKGTFISAKGKIYDEAICTLAFIGAVILLFVMYREDMFGFPKTRYECELEISITSKTELDKVRIGKPGFGGSEPRNVDKCESLESGSECHEQTVTGEDEDIVVLNLEDQNQDKHDIGVQTEPSDTADLVVKHISLSDDEDDSEEEDTEDESDTEMEKEKFSPGDIPCTHYTCKIPLTKDSKRVKVTIAM